MVLLEVGIPQLDLNGANLRRASLALDGELEVIALSHMAELVDFIVIARDEGAHLAARHLNAVLGGIQVGLYAGDIAIQLVHVVRVGLGGQFSLHRGLEIGDFLVDGLGGCLVLLPRGDQIRLRDVQFVRDHLQVALQLLVDFVFLGQALAQCFIGLLQGRLCRLFDTPCLV